MGIVFLHGNGGSGGGGGLNFKVVGNPQPASPSENTIWLNTDAPITGYEFSATEPAEPVEGMVWITIGATSPVAFSAQKKNSVMVYPLSAEQYVSGAWVDVTAKSYQNGAWVDWICDLYVDGSEWKARALAPNGDWKYAYTPSVTKNTDGSTTVSITTPGSGGGGVWELNEDADITSYKTLKLKCKVSLPSRTDGGICAHLMVMPRGTSYWLNNAHAIRTLPSTSGGVVTYDLDISSLSGAYDIAVGVRWNSSWLGAGTVSVTVYDVYLE